MIGLFGGGFDPPHIGHTMLAHYISTVALLTRRGTLGRLHKVWVVPSWEHAFDKRMAPFEHRLEMCNLAFGGMPRVVVRDFEGEWKTRYTYDLVTQLLEDDRAANLLEDGPLMEIVLILGADNLLVADQWHRWDDLMEKVDLFVVGRGGVDNPSKMGSPDMPKVSSTRLREALLKGDLEYAQQHLPDKVSSYIAVHQLYKNLPAPRNRDLSGVDKGNTGR